MFKLQAVARYGYHGNQEECNYKLLLTRYSNLFLCIFIFLNSNFYFYFSTFKT